MSNRVLIQKKIRISDVYAGDIIKTSGGWKTVCPFHDDTDPSLYVNELEDKDLFKCFGCGIGGDVLSFTSMYLHLNKRDAYVHLAKMAGLEDFEYEIDIDPFEKIYKSLQYNYPYLIDKGISESVLKKYNVGYIKDIYSMGLDDSFIKKWKLQNASNSIFYPIKERSGLSVGYYLRPMYKSNIKYFSNSELGIFGIQGVERGSPILYVVEGFHDVLALISNGIKNVISVCGTNFNESMLKYISDHGFKSVVIIPDGDMGGDTWFNRVVSDYGTFNTHSVSVALKLIPYKKNTKINPCDYISVNKDFFTNSDLINPLKQYYNNLDGSVYGKLSTIFDHKKYIPIQEMQSTFSDIYNGKFDLSYIRDNLIDLTAEEITLANMLRVPMIRNTATKMLSESDFSLPTHRDIFSFIKDKQEADFNTIEAIFGISLEKHDTSCYDMYIDRILSFSQKRNISDVLYKNLLSIHSDIASAESIVSGMVGELSDHMHTKESARSADSVVISTIEDLNTDKYSGMSIADKFGDLNEIMHGLCKGRLIAIGGNSGEGKTTLAINMVDSVSVKQNNKTLLLTGEMDAEEIMLRMMAITSGQKYNDILNRNFESEKFLRDIEALCSKNIYFNKLPYIEDVYGDIKTLFLQLGGFDLLVYDYLQLSHSKTNTNKARHQELSFITRTLKTLARELNIAVIGVAQLNKGNINSEISKIENASGAYDMVADADVGITIRKKPPTEGNITAGNTLINIDKMRYNQDKILIPTYFNNSNLQIYETKTMIGGQTN